MLLREIKNKHEVSAILLAETWLKKTTKKKIRVPGYQFVGSHRECKRGGGVGILISNKLQFRERKDLTLDIPNFENITIALKTHKDSILLSALYRPPNTKETEFLKNYKRLLNKFNPEDINRLILGLDHNLDFLKHEKHRPTKEFTISPVIGLVARGTMVTSLCHQAILCLFFLLDTCIQTNQ